MKCRRLTEKKGFIKINKKIHFCQPVLYIYRKQSSKQRFNFILKTSTPIVVKKRQVSLRVSCTFSTRIENTSQHLVNV